MRARCVLYFVRPLLVYCCASQPFTFEPVWFTLGFMYTLPLLLRFVFIEASMPDAVGDGNKEK